MAEWWYHVLHRCPDCNAVWDEYDPKGGACDSGFNNCPTVEEWCEECFSFHQAEDTRENI